MTFYNMCQIEQNVYNKMFTLVVPDVCAPQLDILAQPMQTRRSDVGVGG